MANYKYTNNYEPNQDALNEFIKWWCHMNMLPPKTQTSLYHLRWLYGKYCIYVLGEREYSCGWVKDERRWTYSDREIQPYLANAMGLNKKEDAVRWIKNHDKYGTCEIVRIGMPDIVKEIVRCKYLEDKG